MNDINIVLLGCAAAALLLGLGIGLWLSRRQAGQEGERLMAQIADLRDECDRQAERLVEAERQAASYRQAEAVAQERLQSVAEQLAVAEQYREKFAAVSAELARKESDYKHLQSASSEQIELLKQAKQELSDQFEKFAPPTYISDGLKWLEGQLKQSAASPL